MQDLFLIENATWFGKKLTGQWDGSSRTVGRFIAGQGDGSSVLSENKTDEPSPCPAMNRPTVLLRKIRLQYTVTCATMTERKRHAPVAHQAELSGAVGKRHAPVAQLDRASGYGPEGRVFESSPACQQNPVVATATGFIKPSIIVII